MDDQARILCAIKASQEPPFTLVRCLAAPAMAATPSSKSVKSEIPNTVRVDWNEAGLKVTSEFTV